ncbi:cytosine/adenosine deaminase-related metal-dependent hydrolase [Geothermobacter ehrlichii]|uniref:Cytosine/adenosine deaminase-related metal-dependent hydrolase n=1 Tax=Geothermobacter ehrlichii TaxID=213224 RepID=A0A5D3WMC2_9BACT|nr:amidohydrolase family protein [Geothermobacter ehrlichii]TYO99639.1 cytosine/adenosine deaminase-related metal-dependent hydrolase [Geothermobacter ehrlichii]
MAHIYTARYLVPVASPPVEGGALLVEGERIAAVGRFDEIVAQTAGAEVVDFGESVLLPPMANAHTHLELTDLPVWMEAGEGHLPEGGFVDWLLRVIIVKRQQPADVFPTSIRRGLDLCLEAGTGVIGDILSVTSAVDAYLHTPLLGTVFAELLGQEPQLFRQQLERTSSFLARRPAQHLNTGLSPHSPYTLGCRTLELAADSIAQHGCPASIHAAESAAESRLVRSGDGELAERIYPLAGWEDYLDGGCGLSVIAWLESCGLLRPGLLLVHGVQVDKEDVARIRRHGCGVVLCPRSNERLGVGRAPVDLYRQAGIPLALGTDSLASCDSLSVWDEMAATARIYGRELAPAEILHMATAGGAGMLGLDRVAGTLEPGKGAHFQVVAAPDGTGSRDLVAALVCDGERVRVRQLYLHGKARLQPESDA